MHMGMRAHIATPAIVHADFLASPSHDHDEHGTGHNAPDEHSSRSDSHISLSALLPRSLGLLGVALEYRPLAPPTALPVNTRRTINRVAGVST